MHFSRNYQITGVSLLILGLIWGCASGPVVPPTVTPDESGETAATKPADQNAAPSATGFLQDAQTNALWIIDQGIATDEVLSSFGFLPLRADPQRVNPPSESLKAHAPLLEMQTAISVMHTMLDGQITVDDNGRRATFRIDAASSAEESKYAEFLAAHADEIRGLHKLYYDNLKVRAMNVTLEGGFLNTAGIRKAALQVLEAGAAHGMRTNGEWPFPATDARALWQDTANLGWISSEQADQLARLRQHVDQLTAASQNELSALRAADQRITELRVEHKKLTDAVAEVFFNRMQAGHPFSPALLSSADSLAQALEFVDQLKRDSTVGADKATTLKDVRRGIARMKLALCAEKTNYISSHGQVEYRKAAAFACKQDPPELIYRGRVIKTNFNCSAAFDVPCGTQDLATYEREEGESAKPAQGSSCGGAWCGSGASRTCCASYQVCCNNPTKTPYCGSGPNPCQ